MTALNMLLLEHHEQLKQASYLLAKHLINQTLEFICIILFECQADINFYIISSSKNG